MESLGDVHENWKSVYRVQWKLKKLGHSNAKKWQDLPDRILLKNKTKPETQVKVI